jgi:hypothetical protein
VESIEFVVRAASVALAVTLWVPIAHKLRVVAAGDAARDPLVTARPWLRRRPRVWLSAAIVVESCISAALLLAPSVGAFAFAALCAGYATQLAFLAPDEGCECFGRAAGRIRRDAAIWRNAGLAFLGVLIGAAYGAGAIDQTGLVAAAGGAALLLSPLAAILLLRSVREPGSVAARGGR